MFKFGAIATFERPLWNQPRGFNNHPPPRPTRIPHQYHRGIQGLRATLLMEPQRLLPALGKVLKDQEYDLSLEVFR
jgi:hypothetical protein